MKNYQLEVFTRPTCSDCQELKRFLKQHNIPHREYDLAKNPQKEKDLKSISGSRIVPTLVFTQSSFFGLMRKSKLEGER
ncbi:glutaredoxin family protein [Oceanobacillus kapialis]|uniref:Glutaredoxin family protein n=1 Tax=Oceanobacillus kapialis TaxID=481353 RepID=A0ABW5Q0N7_9BACI